MTQSSRSSLRLPILLVILFSCLFGAATAQSESGAFPDPVVLTAAGQSADANLVQAALARADVSATVENELHAEGVSSVGTLVLVMGGSQKGLGAAGVDVDGELARLDALVQEASAQEVALIGMHVGGEARRGSLSQPFIEAVAPRVPILIVTSNGNQDGYFDDIAAETSATLRVVDNVLQVGNAFQELRTSDE